MLGLKLGILLMAFYGAMLFGISCFHIITEEQWTVETARTFGLGMIATYFDIMVIRMCLKRGIFK